jgi:hypothetical protein
MKQEKQKSISWFKLAEFVERGEKERALGIYKLLALSLSDLAFSYQLEGDILLAFEDEQAINKYFQAVEYYLKQNNIVAAIGTLNHIVILNPNYHTAWDMLTNLYLAHELDKLAIHIKNMINHKQLDHAKSCITKAVTNHLKNKNQLDLFIQQLKELDFKLYEHAKNIV